MSLIPEFSQGYRAALAALVIESKGKPRFRFKSLGTWEY